MPDSSYVIIDTETNQQRDVRLVDNGAGDTSTPRTKRTAFEGITKPWTQPRFPAR